MYTKNTSKLSRQVDKRTDKCKLMSKQESTILLKMKKMNRHKRSDQDERDKCGRTKAKSD